VRPRVCQVILCRICPWLITLYTTGAYICLALPEAPAKANVRRVAISPRLIVQRPPCGAKYIAQQCCCAPHSQQHIADKRRNTACRVSVEIWHGLASIQGSSPFLDSFFERDGGGSCFEVWFRRIQLFQKKSLAAEQRSVHSLLDGHRRANKSYWMLTAGASGTGAFSERVTLYCIVLQHAVAISVCNMQPGWTPRHLLLLHFLFCSMPALPQWR